MATQILGRVRLVFKGAYNAGTTYQKLDTVHHEGIAYSAVSGGFSNITPGADATKWAVIIDTGTNPGIIARLDSDSAKLSIITGAVDRLRADRDSDHELFQAKINQVADSDFIMAQLTPKITGIIASLDSDSTSIQAIRTSLATGLTFTGGLTITPGQSFTFDSLAFTDAHKLEIRNVSNAIVFGGWVLDTDGTVGN
jgi:hypothetical protein